MMNVNESTQYQPFFVSGCPRSGTTLLQVLLDTHSRIALPPESHVFERFSPFFESYGDLHHPDNLLFFASELLRDMAVRQWELAITPADLVENVRHYTVAGVISALFEMYVRKQKKKRWGDKTPQHVFYLDKIEDVFPEARFIFMVRDGRDVAESLRRVHIGPQSIFSIARRWKSYQNAITTFLKSSSSGRCLTVRYEDLVRDPRRTCRKILDFLGEPYLEQPQPGPGSMSGAGLSGQYTGRKTLHDSLSSGVSQKKIGIFRRELSTREIQIFESVAGNELREYGYPLVGPGHPVSLTGGEKILFTIQDTFLRYARKLWSAQGRRLAVIQVRHSLQMILRRTRLQGKNTRG